MTAPKPTPPAAACQFCGVRNPPAGEAGVVLLVDTETGGASCARCILDGPRRRPWATVRWTRS